MLKSIIKKLSSCLTAGLLCFSVVSACPGALIHANADDSDPVGSPVTEKVYEPVTETTTEVQSEETPVVTEEPVETEEPAESEEMNVPEQPAEEANPAETQELSEEQETAEPVTEEEQKATTEETEPSDEIAVQEGKDEIAVEAAPASVATIDGTEYATLADAVTAAQNGQTIILSADVSESVAVSAKAITFDLNGKTWNGNGASTVTVSDNASLTVQNGTMTSQDGYRVITATDSTVTVNNVTLQGNGTGVASEATENTRGGIGYILDSDFTITSSTVTNGKGTEYGGGLYFENGEKDSMTIYGSGTVFTENDATHGSAVSIYAQGGKKRYTNVTIENGCRFENNTSSSALWINEKNNSSIIYNVTVKNSQFINNSSLTNGGAIGFNEMRTGETIGYTRLPSALELNQIIFSNNNAQKYGGAVQVGINVGSTLKNNKFISNYAQYGGAVAYYTNENPLFINKCSFESTGDSYISNSAYGMTSVDAGGGALYLKGYNSKLVNSKFDNNKIENGKGGAIFYCHTNITSGNSYKLELNSVTITNNTATYGGAIASTIGISVKKKDTQIYVADSNISNNVALSKGGAFYVDNTRTLDFSGNTILTENVAYDTGKDSDGKYNGVGGGIYAKGNGAEAVEVNFRENARIFNNKTPNEEIKYNSIIGASSEMLLEKIDHTSYVEDIKLSFESENNKIAHDENGKINILKNGPETIKQDGNSTKYVYCSYYMDLYEIDKIYLDPKAQMTENGPISDLHSSEENVKICNTLKDAIQVAVNTGVNKVYICDPVSINSDTVLDKGVTFERCSNNRDSMFVLGDHVTLTLRNAIVDGGSYESKTAMIDCGASGSSIVLEPENKDNSKVVLRNGNNAGNGYGGAISFNDSIDQHQFTMYGGIFENNIAENGGAVFLLKTDATIYGGLFKNNKATQDNKKFDVSKTGEKLNDTSNVDTDYYTNYGGAVAAYDTKLHILEKDGIEPVLFAGNSVSSSINKITMCKGGALALYGKSEAEIEAATFENNVNITLKFNKYHTNGYFAGGAIYIERYCQMTIYNAEVYGNQKMAVYNGALGQISNCKYSSFEDYGSLIYGSTLPDIYFGNDGLVGQPYNSHYAKFAERALGGADYNWQTGGEALDHYDIGKNEWIGSRSKLSEEAIASGEKQAKVIIRNNKASVSGSGIANNGKLILKSGKQDIEVTKSWNDQLSHDDDSVTVQLAKKYTDKIELVSTDFRKDAIQILNKENDWKATWKDLGVNSEYTWTAVEANKAGYSSEVSFDKEKKLVTVFNIPSTHYNDLTISKDIPGNTGNTQLFEFEVKVILPENHGMLYTYTVNGTQKIVYPSADNSLVIQEKLSNGDSLVINGLEEGSQFSIRESGNNNYNVYVNGEKIDRNDPATGEMSAEKQGISFSNVSTISLTVNKKWDDDNNRDGKRPESVTFRLHRGEEVIDSAELNEGNGWSYTFEGLDKYDLDGNEVAYNITEDAVSNYSTKIDGYNITNTYTPGKTSVTVNKSWVDADNQDGMRPESVTVRLLADGVETDQTVELNADNNWQAIFTDLDEYKIGEVGQKVEYSVEEVNIPEGYEASVTGDATTGYTITNTHETEIINVSGQKTWNDLDNRFGKRPDNITVRLLADGNEIASQVVTADNNWAYTFADLPQYSAGKKIDYTVSEDAVSDYTTEINGYDITNTFETVRINGQKVWNDGNNASGRRPESITVQLLANGVQVAETTANADLDWFFSFGDLPVYENGEKIQYTVTETPVEGYRTNISGDSVNGFTVRNTARPETPRTNDDPKIEVPPTKPTTTTTVKRRPQTPFTGDTTDIAFYGGFAVAGLIVVLGIILFRRKEN